MEGFGFRPNSQKAGRDVSHIVDFGKSRIHKELRSMGGETEGPVPTAVGASGGNWPACAGAFIHRRNKICGDWAYSARRRVARRLRCWPRLSGTCRGPAPAGRPDGMGP